MEQKDTPTNQPHSTPHRDPSAVGFRKTGIIIILGFFILLLLAILIDTALFPIPQTNPTNSTIDLANSLWSGSYILLLNLAAAGITIGAGTVLYAHFDFVQYVKNTLCQVMIENHFIDRLNDQQKEKLMHTLEKHLIYHDTESGNDTLYDFVNTEIRNLTKTPYYEKMSADFHCQKDGSFLVKHIIRRMTLNYQQDESYKFDLPRLTRCYFLGSPDTAPERLPLTIDRLIINGKDLTSFTQAKVSPVQDEREYECMVQYEFTQEMDLGILSPPSKVLTIELRYTTRVPVSDKSFCFRTYFPCKQLDATFVYEPPLFARPDVFCFKDRSCNGGLEKERIQIVRNQNCIHITVSDWLLPGDGIIYYIEEPEQAEAPEAP